MLIGAQHFNFPLGPTWQVTLSMSTHLTGALLGGISLHMWIVGLWELAISKKGACWYCPIVKWLLIGSYPGEQTTCTMTKWLRQGHSHRNDFYIFQVNLLITNWKQLNIMSSVAWLGGALQNLRKLLKWQFGHGNFRFFKRKPSS